ncbi:hypothetical protein PPERSA_00354 [Pseudocohnilembus persalinus]|uniref:Uncharacterized protein n=1 Tax=Pseudocohnilembus persalinus TaxID=266149 RepID=A0A0V0QYP9_PSEPJ|nr:hypothetical protein PPERSA_00354 [Pseudocohnilembus persalinus]|eukprot:KRX07197.1 hypothetical protein PPERSA_00354 [Pseudocohnilembus persalinus]
MEQNLQNLIHQIDQCEKTQEVLQWMEQISQPQFGLIESLIQEFLKSINNNEQSIQVQNGILRAIRKLNEWVPLQITEQMKNNKDFPICLRDYCVKTKINQKIGDAYILLIEIFQKESFQPVINKDFIDILIYDIQYLQDESVLNQIILILVHVAHDMEKNNNQFNNNNSNNSDINNTINGLNQNTINDKNNNIVMEVIRNNQQCQSIISESFTMIVNMGQEDHILSCLNFVKMVFKYQLDQFFYNKDLLIMIEILTRQILEQGNDAYRLESLFSKLLTVD